MDRDIKAVIFDLDGVITETAYLHAKAWKKMFNAYNKRRKEEQKDVFKEFSIEDDYPVYLDGKPRYKGVQSFLESRNIDLPYGTPDDDPGQETICGLGNLKNKYFQELVDEEGVQVIKENVEKAKEWKKEGLKIGIISSSKNCKKILEAAEVEDLFDIRIDGVVSEERNLQGKPDPDIFLEAAKELQVQPQESVIIEDALSGVEAGSKGNFKIVIGISNNSRKDKMLKHGAHVVVENLQEYDLFETGKTEAGKLPWAMDHIEKIISDIQDHDTLLCLDYDGTLTPIVEDYNKAYLQDEMRNQLNKSAEVIPIAIVSGRDIKFIQKQVDLKKLFYAGSHGFEIEGPGDFHYEVEESQKVLPVLDKAENKLRDRFKPTVGVEIERKKYAIAIHYRHVKKEDMHYLHKVIGEILEESPQLKSGEGKKIIELKPNMDWDKGKAVEILCRQILTGNKPDMVLYIGDDVTDEDAFRVIEKGYGILVGHPEHKTYANYYLNDVDEVKSFLVKITDIYEG